MNDVTHNKQDKPLKPEWIRPNQATHVFGIGRTKLYELMAAGKIKTASIRKRGDSRGTRLISYDSLASFIESQVEVGEALAAFCDAVNPGKEES